MRCLTITAANTASSVTYNPIHPPFNYFTWEMGELQKFYFKPRCSVTMIYKPIRQQQLKCLEYTLKPAKLNAVDNVSIKRD
jgi:hypothetical protein